MRIYYCSICRKPIKNYNFVKDMITINCNKRINTECCKKCRKLFDKEFEIFMINLIKKTNKLAEIISK